MQPFESLSEAKCFYEKLRIDTLPLREGSKIPIPQNWQTRSPESMWRNAPENANIGIRCGGRAGVAVLDCDEKTRSGTFINAQNFLEGLGFPRGRYPIVTTASGMGRHIYLRMNESLYGNYRILSDDFGAGEFRFGKGSMVVAPPSEVGDVPYQLIVGDFRDLPLIKEYEIARILKSAVSTEDNVRKPPNISRKAWKLLKGWGLGEYKSRSEAEYALLVSLVNTGRSFDNALALFQKYPCAGKFRELHNNDPQKAFNWLYQSYMKAKVWAENHVSPERQKAQDLMELASMTPWPGRTGSVDRSIFIAHLTIAAKVSRKTYSAGCRELAELAGVTHVTAARATKRLIIYEFIKLETHNVGELSTIYSLNEEMLKQKFSPPDSDMGECNVTLSNDAFRARGLGKSASEVWWVLKSKGPMTTKGLALQTGRHITTVRRALKKMSSLVDKMTGEVASLVEKAPKRHWKALDADLTLVSKIVGTEGKGKRQRIEHSEQRRNYRRRRRNRYTKKPLRID